jgi:hypothetical protein
LIDLHVVTRRMDAKIGNAKPQTLLFEAAFDS